MDSKWEFDKFYEDSYGNFANLAKTNLKYIYYRIG